MGFPGEKRLNCKRKGTLKTRQKASREGGKNQVSGYKPFKEHTFFKSFDWDKLMERAVRRALRQWPATINLGRLKDSTSPYVPTHRFLPKSNCIQQDILLLLVFIFSAVEGDSRAEVVPPLDPSRVDRVVASTPDRTRSGSEDSTSGPAASLG